MPFQAQHSIGSSVRRQALWEELVEEVGVVPLCDVRVTPVGSLVSAMRAGYERWGAKH